MTDQENTLLDRIDTERSIAGSYVLNGSDRKYCFTGEKPEKISKSELKSRVRKDRIQKFPLRFQDLFDDIALIEYSDVDFVSESEREELWNEIIDVDSRTATTLGFDIRSGVGHGSEFQFGVEMGSTTRALRQTEADDPVDLIWGFILGMCGLPIESYDREFQNIDNLLNNLSDLNNRRNEDIEPIQEHIEKDDTLMGNVENRVEKAFEKNDINPANIPFSVIELWREMFRLTDLDEDIYDKLDDVINVEQLKKSIKFRDVVEQDIRSIKEEQFRGQYAEPLINDIYNNTNKNERIQFGDLISVNYDSGAKKILKQYSISGKHKDQLQDTTIDKNGNDFGLTDYGRLLAFCMFEEDNTDWILKYNIIHKDPHGLLKSEKLSDKKHNLVKNAIEEIDWSISEESIQ